MRKGRGRVVPAMAGLSVLGGLAGPAAAGPVDVVAVSSDRYTNPTSQHRTQVEPDTFAYGDTVVVAFQSGRFAIGTGASNNDFATSTDAGRTWTSGGLPSLTIQSTPAGTFHRATDPSVAYDSAHGQWLISSLGVVDDPLDPADGVSRQVVVSRSGDGLDWSAPVAVSAPGGADKNWVTCDNWDTSPFRGRCYVAWSDPAAGGVQTSTSLDGGVTWAASVTTGTGGIGAQPVTGPDGRLVVVAVRSVFDMIAVTSTDGGAGFGPVTVITDVQNRPAFPSFRNAYPLPSVEVDGDGTIYVAFQTCRFRGPSCTAPNVADRPPNDVALTVSSDGATWSAPTRVPTADLAGTEDALIYGLAVDPDSSGRRAKLALTYVSYAATPCDLDTCELNVGMVESSSAGVRWTRPRQLNPVPMSLKWLPNTAAGRMVGDYISTSFVGRRIVGAFPLAGPPAGTTFDQSMHVAIS